VDCCAACGYAYDSGAGDLPARLASFGPAYADALRHRADDAVRARPDAGIWSALEYACHVRDVLLVQRDRLYDALVEDTPRTHPMHRDDRPVLAHYNEQDPAVVVAQLAMAAELISQSFAVLDAAQFERRLVYAYPEPVERSVLWLGQNAVHEAHHHLQDVHRVLGTVDG
jgi:hypothetical protein